jgi:hypothetical protein
VWSDRRWAPPRATRTARLRSSRSRCFRRRAGRRMPLTCATPVELDAVLPPPTCAAPVDCDAELSPAPTATGAVPRAEACLRATCAPGRRETGDAWTTPVDPDEVLPPPPELAVEPLGDVAVAVARSVPTLAVGLVETGPTWTTPVEPVASLPACASDGSAPTTTTAIANASDRMRSPLGFVGRRARASRRSTCNGMTAAWFGRAAAATPFSHGEREGERAAAARHAAQICRSRGRPNPHPLLLLGCSFSTWMYPGQATSETS